MFPFFSVVGKYTFFVGLWGPRIHSVGSIYLEERCLQLWCCNVGTPYRKKIPWQVRSIASISLFLYLFFFCMDVYCVICSSRPRGEQHLARWAINHLHDIASLSRMVDPSLNGGYLEKSLSQFADIISICIQVSCCVSWYYTRLCSHTNVGLSFRLTIYFCLLFFRLLEPSAPLKK